MSVRTRFAPSPTGYLHIGGVRTALFNWLFARRHGGQFILRIDDTDRQRNVEAALRPILDGFRWLGIDWDEGPEVGGPCAPYYQSQRTGRYRDAVSALLDRGLAYRDYATAAETTAEREAAQRDKQRFIYSRRWMAETDADAARFEGEGRTAVVRLKMPREGACRFDDLVRGPVAFDWALEQDHVIQRADGSHLYHLASAVDDHDFGISHVIRAEEHLSNTPRQVFIADGLAYERPRYAHLPYVAAPGGSEKLSKRKLGKYLSQPEFKKVYDHGAGILAALGDEVVPERFNPVLVDFYRDVGYRSEALVNYLLLLGWSLDDRTEDFTREEMIEHFSLERVNRSAASFDPQKMMAFEERRMNALSEAEKAEAVFPYLVRLGLLGAEPTAAERARVDAVVAAAGDRIKVAGDIVHYPEFFQDDAAISYDEKAFRKRIGAPEAAERLRRFRPVLETAEPFGAATLESALHRFVEDEGIKIGQIIHAVRVAVTGNGVGFGVFDALEILGRAACLARIDRALDLASKLPEERSYNEENPGGQRKTDAMGGITKRIVCLASSTKFAGRCVAGKEVETGAWIRPVSRRPGQEVSEDERRYRDNGDPVLLDVMDVPLLEPQPVDHQTENWLLDPDRRWERAGTVSLEDLDSIADNPPRLWVNGSSAAHGENDRVKRSEAQRLSGSLCLARVSVLRLRVFVPFGKKQTRGQFEYCGSRYDLAVTDPAYDALPKGTYSLGPCYVTISLGESFKGYCYKLIAAIFNPGSMKVVG